MSTDKAAVQEGPGVSCRISLPIDGKAVADFTRRVAAALQLGPSYLYPTRIVNSRGEATELEWCADGWTPEGVSIWLLASPEEVELQFGNSLRPRPPGVALRDAFAGGDARLKNLDLTDWQRRLQAAVDAALS